MIKDIEKYITKGNNYHFSNSGLIIKNNGHISFKFNNTVSLYFKYTKGSDRVIYINGERKVVDVSNGLMVESTGDIIVSREKASKGEVLLSSFSIKESDITNIIMNESWHDFVKKVNSIKGIKLTDNGVLAIEGAEINGTDCIKSIETDPPNAFINKDNKIKFVYPCRIIKIDSEITDKKQPTIQYESINLKSAQMMKSNNTIPIQKRQLRNDINFVNGKMVEIKNGGVVLESGGSFDLFFDNVDKENNYILNIVMSKISGNGRIIVTENSNNKISVISRERVERIVSEKIFISNYDINSCKLTISMPVNECSGKVFISSINLIKQNSLGVINENSFINSSNINCFNNTDKNALVKNITASIIITTYKRPHLLRWGLYSIARQKCDYKFEVIVVNDGIEDETESICSEFKDKIDIKYIFTGQRNSIKETWRVPGFAFNIGVKKSIGDIIFLSCAEMFHMGNSIENMINCIIDNPNSRIIINGKDDIDGGFLRSVVETNGNPTMSDVDNYCSTLNSHLPFFMAMNRIHYFNIGGYDEDFTGIAWEDNDFIYRLEKYGVKQVQTSNLVVHLWHQRISLNTPEIMKLWHYNELLYKERLGIVNRNEGKEWGKYELEIK